MRGEARPRERGEAGTCLEVPPPHPLSTLSHLSAFLCMETAARCPFHTLGLRVRCGSLRVEMSTDSHTGHGSGHWYTGQKTDARLSFKKPGPAWGCSPCQMNGRKRPWRGRGQGWGTVSGALPDTHSQGPPEVQVEEVLHLMCDLKPEAFADHHVPGGAELLVHRLFDHLGGTLEHRGRSLQGAVAGEGGVSPLPPWEAGVLAGGGLLPCHRCSAHRTLRKGFHAGLLLPAPTARGQSPRRYLTRKTLAKVAEQASDVETGPSV